MPFKTDCKGCSCTLQPIDKMNTCPTLFASQLCKVIADSTRTHGVRSSRRTDDIHKLVADWIVARNPRTTCKIEKKLVIETGTIAVDLIVYSAATEAVIACVSFKGLMNNVVQNKTNNENVKLGEAVKIASGIPLDAKVVFFDVVPAECPYYNAGGVIVKTETNEPTKWKLRENALISMANRRIEQISDIYTIFPRYVWQSRKEMEFDRMEDCEDLSRMAAFVDGLAPL